MRRKSRFLAAVCLAILLLAGCAAGKDTQIPEEGFPQVNFNNTIPTRQPCFFFDQAFFYEQDGFYNMGIYRCQNGTYTKLVEESDFQDAGGFKDYYVSGNDLYFVTWQSDMDQLYRYDLRTDTYEFLYELETSSDWCVADSSFIYKTDYPESSLWVMDLETGENTRICEKILEFGIIDREVRYIVSGDVYELYGYHLTTGTTVKLGQFSLDDDSRWRDFNFTPDEVTMCFGEDKRVLSVYSIPHNTVTEYTMPRGIHEMVAGENAVFLLVYDSHKNNSIAVPSAENGVYRVNLEDGNWELVTGRADDQTKIYVCSDDCIYLVQSGFFIPGFYSSTAYRLDIGEGTQERVGKYRILWD